MNTEIKEIYRWMMLDSGDFGPFEGIEEVLMIGPCETLALFCRLIVKYHKEATKNGHTS